MESARNMAPVRDQSVALVVTSPPYPMIEMWDQGFSEHDECIRESLSKGDGEAAFEMMHAQLDPVWSECYRTLQPGGFLCVNVGDATRKVAGNFRLYTNHSRITTKCEELGFQSLPAILWRKQTNAPNKFMGSGMLPAGAYVTLEHEYLLVFRKGERRPADSWRAGVRSASSFFWEERNVWFSDSWELKGVRQGLGPSEARARSAAYPFELPYRIVNMYSVQGGTVMDPFLGTGTTLAACVVAARNSLGFERVGALWPTIAETVTGAAEIANKIVSGRLMSHVSFVADREAGPSGNLAHRSEVYGFPVMTKQERLLRLLRLDALEEDENHVFRARHSPATLDMSEGRALAQTYGSPQQKKQHSLPFA